MPEVTLRKATRADVPKIVRLLAEDVLGEQRERYQHPIPQSYYDAFDAIDADTNQELMLVLQDVIIIGTFQLIYTPCMALQGAKRMTIEAVRVDPVYRRQGIGTLMIEWSISRAKEKGCRLVQLTSHKQRKEAHRFYEQLGFSNSHEGFKMELK